MELLTASRYSEVLTKNSANVYHHTDEYFGVTYGYVAKHPPTKFGHSSRWDLLNPRSFAFRVRTSLSATTNNLLLDSLSPKLRETILSFSSEIALPINYLLQEQDQHPRFAYFLTSGLASVVIELSEGGTAEVALVGHEGLANSPSLLGPSAAPTRCFMQIEGSGLRSSMQELQALFASSEEFRNRVLAFIQMQLLTTSQLSACNRLHEAEPRLARWLLMVSDRVEGDPLHLTHEFLAQMLGVHRPTLTISIGILERAGLIQNGRGSVSILSHEALERAACDCYPVTKRLIKDLYI